MLSLAVFETVYSENTYLRGLGDVMKQEQSISNQVYIFERCSAVFAAIGARMQASGRADSQTLGENMLALGSNFLVGAVSVAKGGKLNYTQENALKEVIAIGKIYGAQMDDNHRRTGNAIDGQVLADQRLCMTIAQELKK